MTNCKNLLIKTVSTKLTEYPASRYLIGFSGGRDSSVLLDIVAQLRQQKDLNIPIVAIHVNHQLNEKSNNWAKHCQRICDYYDIPLIIETLTQKPQPRQSIEAFARDARYQLIQQHIQVGDIFLSAHHRRDQAETFLLQLMRGAGLDGLRSMPVVKPFGKGQYLRPLLDIDFADIVKYAEQQNLAFVEDDSNADTQFDRNYIRHQILPVLEHRFPHAQQNIAKSAMWLAEIPEVDTPICLKITDLKQLSETEQKQQIRAFVKSKTGLALSQNQTYYLLSHHLMAQADKHPVLELDKYVIRRFNDEIIITEPLPELSIFDDTIQLGQPKTFSAFGQLSWKKGEGILTTEKLTIKSLDGTMRFHPSHRHHSRTIKKLLHEAGIEPWLRQCYFGLFIRDELIAIPNIGIAKAYFVKDENAQTPIWQIESRFVKI